MADTGKENNKGSGSNNKGNNKIGSFITLVLFAAMLFRRCDALDWITGNKSDQNDKPFTVQHDPIKLQNDKNGFQLPKPPKTSKQKSTTIKVPEGALQPLNGNGSSGTRLNNSVPSAAGSTSPFPSRKQYLETQKLPEYKYKKYDFGNQ